MHGCSIGGGSNNHHHHSLQSTFTGYSVPRQGFEPRTNRLESAALTVELQGHMLREMFVGVALRGPPFFSGRSRGCICPSCFVAKRASTECRPKILGRRIYIHAVSNLNFPFSFAFLTGAYLPHLWLICLEPRCTPLPSKIEFANVFQN